MKPIRITVRDEETGEVREWSVSRLTLTMMRRALKAYRWTPDHLADRFHFPGPPSFTAADFGRTP